MKLKYLFFCVITIIIILTGCGGHTNYNQGYKQGESSKKYLEKPNLLGWDRNGYKVFDTNKEKLALNNKATAEKAILVEDAIICEEKDILLSFVEKNINSKIGTDFVKSANLDVEIYLVELRTKASGVSLPFDSDKESDTLAKTFLKHCSATKNPQLVNIIERKPISKITKIELLIDNQPYYMWTMEEHLINPTAM
jgi:hypothetical protein